MKGTDLFCASPASTAICSSMDRRAVVRRGPGPIDHHHHHTHHRHHRLRDRPENLPHHQVHHYAPCSSQLPIDPKPFYEKCRKSFSSITPSHHEQRRKSSADIHDLKKTDFKISPAGHSSRHLLSDSVSFIDWVSEADDRRGSTPLVPAQIVPSKPRGTLMSSNAHSNSTTALRSSSTRSRHQVVVLRVSLHCKGCEGKVRKHLAKMEGVTSFSIDLPTKKVTVIGDVTPLSVLASVSKVKRAQLWPSPSSSPSSRWSA